MGGIPWEFVRDFAKIMAGVTRSGWAGLYDQGFWDQTGMLGVYVGLRIMRQLPDGWVPQRVPRG